MLNLGGAEEVRILQIGKLVTSHNAKAVNDVYLQQLSKNVASLEVKYLGIALRCCLQCQLGDLAPTPLPLLCKLDRLGQVWPRSPKVRKVVRMNKSRTLHPMELC